jgi:UDP-N-acetylmuramoylalanine--D-glutamate ligase
MEDAVRKAHEVALPGDMVLLSPMCSSFDMFKDYKDRGNAFRRIVESL